ncbi:hypothetical protein [Faecalimonas sp.]
MLLPIDESKAEVPNSAENRKHFGKSNNQHSELAKKNLNHLTHIDIRQPVLAIFDRRYPSIEFIDF